MRLTLDAQPRPIRILQGINVYASDSKMLRAGQRALVRVDLQMAIPIGYYGSLCGRSGLANTRGVVAFPGVVDSGYRGIVCVILFNFSDTCYKVEKGSRIAQMLIKKCYNVDFVLCNDEEFGKYCDTDRGTDGFDGFDGSSGF